MPDNKGQGIEYSIEYKFFDQKGNWLKMIRIIYGKNIPKQYPQFKADTVTRKITYY